MKISCVLVFVYCFTIGAHAQCPDRIQLRERILYLRSSTVDYRQQLNELLPVSTLLEKCQQKNDSVRVLLLQRIGALSYLTGDFSEAVIWTLDAIKLLQDANNTYKDTAFLLKVYNFLQVYYDSLKLVDNKMSAIDSCIHYALSTNAVDDAILYNFWQLSTYTFERGDFERCIEYSSMGETLSRKYASTDDSIAYASSFFTNRNNALIEMGEYARAETDLHSKINELRSAGFERLCGPFYNSLSVMSLKTYKNTDALHYLKTSLEINKRYKQLLFIKENMNNIGFFYINNLNDPVTGLKYFKEALTYKSPNSLDAAKDENETFHITANIGYAYALLNQFDSSDVYFQRAFSVLGKGEDEKTLASMPMNQFNLNAWLIYITGVIRLKAASVLRRFQVTGDIYFLDKSLSIYKAGDRILTKGKAGQMELQSQLFWRKDARQLYEQAINGCYIGKRPKEAFEFFERSRAVLLFDEISRNRSMSTTDMYTRSQIESRIMQLRSQLDAAAVHTDKHTEIQKNILFLNKQKDRLLSSRNTVDTTLLTLSVFKNKYVLNGETLLEMFIGDTSVFILAINKNNTTLKKIIKSRFEDLSSSFLQYVGDPVKCNSNFDDFISTANQLYHLIFDSIHIEEKIIVSPDENYFPFEALVTTVNKSEPDYLVRNCAITYTYSAGFLLLDFNPQQAASSALLLGMAPVRFPSVYSLASLEGSDGSLEKIVSRFRASKSIVNSSATKNEFLNSFYKFRVVQLYTHGAETGKSGVPVIYFADSVLNLFDLIPVDQPATQLVVLSACETAKGKYYKGEGVFSFNRAFAEAGVPSSMVNLWSVDNQSSYRLTELFYKYLAKNIRFDEALRQAKVEFILTSGKEKSLPFYWAATVLAGKSSSLEQHSGISWLTTAGIILLGIAVVIGLFRYFKRSEPYNLSSTEQYW
jgi:CHAT domain-containing protein/tetratricopeptide (TPR) repeat protein